MAGTIAPEWALGLSMGLGGICGSYLGARLQRHLPEVALRRLLGVVCVLLAVRYALHGVGVGAIRRSVAPRPFGSSSDTDAM